jgi:transglutaminase-like putative cysteine protease
VTAARRYRIWHETVYSYGGDVAHSHQLLHLSPRASARQICESQSLDLVPLPTNRHESMDAFDNPVTRLEYDRPHARLEVCSDMVVEVKATVALSARDSLPWERVRDALKYSAHPIPANDLEACRFRMQSSYVHLKQVFAQYSQDCFFPGRATLFAAEELMHKIHREFRYVPGATRISTSAAEVLEAKRGVCQDFAHVMIACLRSIGLAARYVSGYLRTVAPTDAALVGADASHAWVSVYCPPIGWVDLDPTNDMRVGTDHIVLSWGRDFGDVSPLRGVIVGGGRHDLLVRVAVQPLN